jgi:hypothetical protein
VTETRKLPVTAASLYTREVLLGIAHGESRVARAALEKGPDGVTEAAELAAARASALCRASLAAAPPPSPLACAPGCSFCCRVKVLVMAPEAIRIAEQLRRANAPGEVAAVAERVREVDAATRGKTRRERAGAAVACPLLVDGRCSVYEVRPLLCRGWNSLDARACERWLHDPTSPAAPIHAASHEVANAVLAGLGLGGREVGLDATPLELVAALRVALENPDAAERLLAGDPLFQPARDAEWLAENGGRSG